MKPDMQSSNPLQNKSFSKTSPMGPKTASVADEGFAGVKDARIKDYAVTRSFFGIKNPWFGNKVFGAKEAGLWSNSMVDNANRKVPVKKAEAVGFYDSTKNAYFGSPVVPTPTFVPQPGAQGSIARIKDKITNKMTIDEVRELLNKPR